MDEFLSIVLIFYSCLYLIVLVPVFILKKLKLIKKCWKPALIICAVIAAPPWAVYRPLAVISHLRLAQEDMAIPLEQIPPEIEFDISLMSEDERNRFHIRWQNFLLAGVFQSVRITDDKLSTNFSLKERDCTKTVGISHKKLSKHETYNDRVWVRDSSEQNTRYQLLEYAFIDGVSFTLPVIDELIFLPYQKQKKCLQVDPNGSWIPSYKYSDTGDWLEIADYGFVKEAGRLRQIILQKWDADTGSWETIYKTTQTAFPVPILPAFPYIRIYHPHPCTTLGTQAIKAPQKYNPPCKAFLEYYMAEQGSLEDPVFHNSSLQMKPVSEMQMSKENIESMVAQLLSSKSLEELHLHERVLVDRYLDLFSSSDIYKLTESGSEIISKLFLSREKLFDMPDIWHRLKHRNFPSHYTEAWVQDLIQPENLEHLTDQEKEIVSKHLVALSFPLPSSDRKTVSRILTGKIWFSGLVEVWQRLAQDAESLKALLPELVEFLPYDQSRSYVYNLPLLLALQNPEYFLPYEKILLNILENTSAANGYGYAPLLLIFPISGKEDGDLFRKYLVVPTRADIKPQHSYDNKMYDPRWAAAAVCASESALQDELLPDILKMAEEILGDSWYWSSGSSSYWNNFVTQTVTSILVMLRERQDKENAEHLLSMLSLDKDNNKTVNDNKKSVLFELDRRPSGSRESCWINH